MSSATGGGSRQHDPPDLGTPDAGSTLLEGAAERVAYNLRSVRHDRGLDLADVSERLDQLGHPIGINALSKIELGKRRVVADDLLALALVLDTTPVRLLLPRYAGQDLILVADEVAASGAAIWRWAIGDWPLHVVWTGTRARPSVWSGLWDNEEPIAGAERAQRFRSENRPYDPDDTTVGELLTHRGALQEIAVAVLRANRQGVNLSTIVKYIDLWGVAMVGNAAEAESRGQEASGDTDAETLRDQVRTVVAAMQQTTPEKLAVDADGDISIRAGTAMVFVRVHDNPPLVDVFSPLLTEIQPNEKLYGRLSELTNRMRVGRLYCANDTVWASVPVFGRSFQPSHLILAVQVMTGLADELDERLQGEFGGRRFFAQPETAATKPVSAGDDRDAGL